MSLPASTGEEETSRWSREDEKTFENALATVPYPAKDEGEVLASQDRWLGLVAARVPGKTINEIKKHYGLLIEDVSAIDTGMVPIPCYADDSCSSPRSADQAGKKHSGFADRKAGSGGFDLGGQCKGGSKSDLERKKGIPWTEEEHRLFLIGLKKFGKGDWRSISRNYVVSRTPTQVASHAQKYFIRLNSMNRDRRRSSIHDITNVNNGDAQASSQGPITGEGILNCAAHPGSFINPPPPPPPVQLNVAAMGVYGPPPMGHPVPGHIISAVGPPVMLPPGHAPYVMPVGYPIPPTMHQ